MISPSDTSEPSRRGRLRGALPALCHKYERDQQSRWSRFRCAFDRFVDSVLDAVREPRLADRLPPHDGPDRDERGELLLLNIMRAPGAYQRGAIDVARYALALRRLGDEAYAEGMVHLALSRLRPDKDGTITIARLRDVLCDIPFSGTLVPALRRLEAHGIIAFTWTGTRPERVELRIPL